MVKRLMLVGAFLLAAKTGWACTNFLAGKGATVDGSTLVTYAADSYSLYGALYHYPAATYPPGTMLDIHEWDTGEYLGQITQAERTYSVVGNMNEHQLCIGETTFGGRPELVDTTGIMDYGSLIYVTLQRARTAREAIRTMDALVQEYGYYSSGESFSIADPDEVWIMELIGKGPGRKGAVWVARRLPDDCVSAHANQARITTFPKDDPENCLYSPDVISFAREMGYYKGKDKDFSFSDTYAPLDFGGLFWCEARVWTFFRKLDPGMDRFASYVVGDSRERMPLWIKPDRKISAQDMKEFMRDQFEGTPFDVPANELSGPFHTKLRFGPLSFMVDSVEYSIERPVATQQTGFSFVAQMRGWLPDAVGGILWFGVDDAATSLYVPMYCGIQDVPACYRVGNGSLLEYSPTSAFWTYNAVANFAYGRYEHMLPDIKRVQGEWETYFNTLVPAVDSLAASLPEAEARALLTDFSVAQAQASTDAWKQLGEFLLVRYIDGAVKAVKDGRFVTTATGLPKGTVRPPYPEDYLREMVKRGQLVRVRTIGHE